MLSTLIAFGRLFSWGTTLTRDVSHVGGTISEGKMGGGICIIIPED
jgi:hypothetical protein